MACQYNFPAKMPVDCGFELVAMVRAGTLLVKRGTALQLVGQVIGQSGALMDDVPSFGSMQTDSSYASPGTTDTIEACCRRMELEVGIVDENAMAANPFVMMLLGKLAKLILAELFK